MYASSNSIAKGTRRCRQTLISFFPDDLASLLTASAVSSLSFLPYPSMLLQHGASAWNIGATATTPAAAVGQDPLTQSGSLADMGTSRGVLQPCGNYLAQPAGGVILHSGLQRRDMLQVVLSGYGSIAAAAGGEASALRLGPLIAKVAAGFLQAMVGGRENIGSCLVYYHL